jgi:hypothetical protein
LACTLLIAACGSGTPRSVDPLHIRAPEIASAASAESLSLESLGVLEGNVVDVNTRADVGGATVVAQPSHGDPAAAITDASGSYRIWVPAGAYALSLYYADVTIQHDQVTVSPLQSTRSDFEFDAVAADTESKRPAVTCPTAGNGTVGDAAVTDDYHDVVAAVLRRRETDWDPIPDFGLIPAHGEINVLRDVEVDGEHHRITDTEVRALDFRFTARSMYELQAEADRRSDRVPYVDISAIVMSGSCATVTVGADYVLPSETELIKMCCCAADDVYQKRRGVWTFIGRTGEVCA